jgi:mannosylglycerate hydrolase
VGDDWIENEHLKVRVRPDGTLSVRDKHTRREFDGVLELQDSGDLGDEYNYDPPDDDVVITKRDAEDIAVQVEQNGPLVGVLHVDGVLPAAGLPPVGDEAEPEDPELPFTIRVSLAAGRSRVEIGLAVTNAAENHRLRVVFPTGAEHVETSRADAAFGVVTRPARRPAPVQWKVEAPVSTAPLQSFVDAGDATSGMSVFSEGLMEYEITEEPRPRIALTLLRAVGRLSSDDLGTRHGHAGPGLETPGAQCLGEAAFRFAFAPRGAPPSEAELYQEARAFLAPPRVFGPAGRDGRVRNQHCFLEIASDPPGAAVLSALKRADDRDSLIVRVFNSGDSEASVTIGGLRAAHRCDLREERGEALAVRDGRATVSLGSRRIETVEISLAAS